MITTRKKSIVILNILVVLIFVCLFCYLFKQHTASKTNQYKIAVVEKEIAIRETLTYLHNSNKDTLDSLYAIKDEDFEKAILSLLASNKKLEKAYESLNLYMSSSNFISHAIEGTIYCQNSIIEILNDNNIPEYERDQLLSELSFISSELHLNSLKYTQCIIELNEIRKFNQYTDVEANQKLTETWRYFYFDIECPKSIEKQELYLLWANKYVPSYNQTDIFLKNLNSLRKNDNLTSEMYNKKWADFIYESIHSQKWTDVIRKYEEERVANDSLFSVLI